MGALRGARRRARRAARRPPYHEAKSTRALGEAVAACGAGRALCANGTGSSRPLGQNVPAPEHVGDKLHPHATVDDVKPVWTDVLVQTRVGAVHDGVEFSSRGEARVVVPSTEPECGRLHPLPRRVLVLVVKHFRPLVQPFVNITNMRWGAPSSARIALTTRSRSASVTNLAMLAGSTTTASSRRGMCEYRQSKITWIGDASTAALYRRTRRPGLPPAQAIGKVDEESGATFAAHHPSAAGRVEKLERSHALAIELAAPLGLVVAARVLRHGCADRPKAHDAGVDRLEERERVAGVQYCAAETHAS